MQKRHQPSFIARLFGGSKKITRKPVKSGQSAPLPFQSISILHGIRCCTAAKDVEGYRFLSRHAPPLPLTECSMRKTCECRYIKFQDRRGNARREGEFGMKATLFAASERRKSRERRTKK